MSKNSPHLLSSPCVTPGTTLQYKYGERSFIAKASSTAGVGACMQLARDVIESDLGSFKKAPKQPAITKNQNVFAMSYYFDRAVEIGAVGLGDAG